MHTYIFVFRSGNIAGRVKSFFWLSPLTWAPLPPCRNHIDKSDLPPSLLFSCLSRLAFFGECFWLSLWMLHLCVMGLHRTLSCFCLVSLLFSTFWGMWMHCVYNVYAFLKKPQRVAVIKETAMPAVQMQALTVQSRCGHTPVRAVPGCGPHEDGWIRDRNGPAWVEFWSAMSMLPSW